MEKGKHKESFFEKWKVWVRKIKKELFTLYFAYKDKRTPFFTKVIILSIIGYAFSPIDLIPDFIPILGYLDDFLLLPIGIYFAVKLTPKEVLLDARQKVSSLQVKPKNWVAGIIIIMIWILIFILLGRLILF